MNHKLFFLFYCNTFLLSEIIDDLADHAERTDSRIVHETRQVRIIDRKERTWGMYFVVFV